MPAPISTVIRTKDSALTLPVCLSALSRQTHPIDEIIVVDSGSSDETLEIAQQNGCRLVHYDCSPPKEPFNYSKALNLGIETSTHELVFILSSHCEVYNVRSVEWLVASLQQDAKAIGVSLNKCIGQQAPVVAGYADLQIASIDRQSFRGFALSNAANMIRKSSWEERAFDESLATAENIDWSMYFINRGGRVLRFENDFVQYNNPSYSPKKDILELLYIAKLHYPQGRSWRRFLRECKAATSQAWRGNRKKALVHWLYAYYLLLDKTIGVSPRAMQN